MARRPSRAAPSLPQIRAIFRHDFAVLDQQTTPGRDPAILQIVVADNGELGFVIAPGPRVGNLARLDERSELFLPVLEPDSDVRRSFYAPEKVEVIAVSLILIRLRD